MIKDKIRFNFINELQMKANIYCKYLWNIKFDGVIDVNNRLRSTEAQFIGNKNKIEFNKSFLNNVNKYFIDETLIHELCHWYCYKNNMNYNDGDLEFETEIFKNGSRSTETAYIDENNKVWVYNQDQCFIVKNAIKITIKLLKSIKVKGLIIMELIEKKYYQYVRNVVAN